MDRASIAVAIGWDNTMNHYPSVTHRNCPGSWLPTLRSDKYVDGGETAEAGHHRGK